jgi:hypothetical protein
MARSRKVVFNEEAAGRVVRATLAYERGNRDQSPIRFRTVDDGSPHRIARTTEQSDKGSQVAVQPIYTASCNDEGSGSGSETVTAYNILFPIAAGAEVIISQAENGCWYIIGVSNECYSSGSGSGECDCVSIGGQDLSQLDGYDGWKVQLLGHEYGCLKWFDTTDCDEGSGSGSGS